MLATDNLTFSSLKDGTSPAGTALGTLFEWIISTGPGRLLSLMGYNSGAAMFLQLFDLPRTPIITVTGSSNSQKIVTGDVTGFSTGDRVRNVDIGGITTAGWVYIGKPYGNNGTFALYPGHASAMADTSRVSPNDNQIGTMVAVPMHSQAIAAADNYSFIVPTTGIGLGRGLVIGISDQLPYYHPLAAAITALVTIGMD
jgi:hypothetical protein